MNFGQSYLLDCYGVVPGVCDDIELVYRFLEKLVPKIGMKAFSPPIVVHGPTDEHGREIYADKAGVSGVIFLIESSIVVHTIEPTRFISIDCYSCRNFDSNIVLDFAHETFGFQRFHEQNIIRGPNYPNGNGQTVVAK